MTENDIQPPQTVKEVGIHLVYISRELHELKKTIADMPNGFTTLEAHSELKDRVSALENRQGIKQTLLWVGLVASSIINIVALYNLFTGR